MQLTETQIELVIKKLTEISPSGITCPVCGKKNWNVNNIITEIREFQNGNLVVGGGSSLVPLINITCSNCSHTLFFNALLLGIIDKDGETPKKD